MALRGNTYQTYFHQNSFECLGIGSEDHLKQLLRSMCYILQINKETGGRPRATFVKSLQKATGMDNHALFQLVQNWEEWQRFVARKIKTKPQLFKLKYVIYLKRQQIFVQPYNKH